MGKKPDKINRMSIKAVILDFGGVLYFPPDLTWARRWQRLMGLKGDPFISAILSSPEQSEFVNDIMTGRISESEAWEMAANRWKISPMLFQRARKGALSPRRWNKEMANFISNLRPRYKTAILSNAGSDARQTFGEAYKIGELVDDVIISAEVKVAKPDERIYWITVDRLGVEPQEAVFIDDQAPNVDAARRIGMQAIQFVNTAQAIADLQTCLD